jgi:hypothetical protein
MAATPFSRIPQPMIGMNWEPSPSDYTQIPAPSKYGDTDFANDDFVALWHVDSSGVGRHDLSNIKHMLCNTVKMYNWSVPAPTGYWMRNHANFLTLARQLGLSVIVPISNFFTGTAYNNRAAAGGSGAPPANGGGPPANAALQGWITAIVTEIYASGAPAPAIMWAIGNEYDNDALGAYGYCEAVDIATIASYIMAAEASLNVSADNVLAFTSPVTTALIPVNTSIPSSNQKYNTLMGGCAIEALIQAFNSVLGPTVTSQRFIASVNSYQIGQQLVDYNTKFPTVFPGVNFFYGELGFSASSGQQTQAKNIRDQFSHTVALAQRGSPFYGACCFEYSDELWKGPPQSSETMFGTYTFTGGASPISHEGNHAPVWGASYPVDNLTPRLAVIWFESGVTGVPPPPIGR